jgi:2-polyprenyl-6-methoxyphenol hydroxylase-like FAD-dependent oxidoreductase
VRFVCVGGGPAGLYFAIAAARRDPRHEITVLEQDPPGATYGFGVTAGEHLFDVLFEEDPPSARRLHAAAVTWRERQLCLYDRPAAYFPGYGYGIARATLLEILAERATQLGVQVRHETRVADLAAYADADVVVVADGANSAVRSAHPERFGTRIAHAANTYLWLGTEHRFEHLTFVLERTSAGLIWLHGYPSVADGGTCVVECAPATRDALGLAGPDAVSSLQQIFAARLAGGALLTRSRSDTARWQQFAVVRNDTWVHENVMLIGDAAHTTHFSLGRGTRLALVDGVGLADTLHRHGAVTPALAEFDQRRRPAVSSAQERAQHSMQWFEQMDAHQRLHPLAFGMAMSGAPPRVRLRDRLAQRGVLRRRYRRADERRAAATMAARRRP